VRSYKNEDSDNTEIGNISDAINVAAVKDKCHHYRMKNDTLQMNFVPLFETQLSDKLLAPNSTSQQTKQINGIVCAQQIKNPIVSTIMCATNRNEKPTSEFDAHKVQHKLDQCCNLKNVDCQI